MLNLIILTHQPFRIVFDVCRVTIGILTSTTTVEIKIHIFYK